MISVVSLFVIFTVIGEIVIHVMGKWTVEFVGDSFVLVAVLGDDINEVI